jgi:hypothetical protein
MAPLRRVIVEALPLLENGAARQGSCTRLPAVPEDDHGSARMGPTPDEAANERIGIGPLRGTG